MKYGRFDVMLSNEAYNEHVLTCAMVTILLPLRCTIPSETLVAAAVRSLSNNSFSAGLSQGNQSYR